MARGLSVDRKRCGGDEIRGPGLDLCDRIARSVLRDGERGRRAETPAYFTRQVCYGVRFVDECRNIARSKVIAASPALGS